MFFLPKELSHINPHRREIIVRALYSLTTPRAIFSFIRSSNKALETYTYWQFPDAEKLAKRRTFWDIKFLINHEGALNEAAWEKALTSRRLKLAA